MSGSSDDARGGPLAGVTVVDISRVLTGPYATMILGDLGARVIKVERPDTGDDTRQWGPPFVNDDPAADSTYFLSANRNKQSVRLDLKDAAGLRALHRMVASADILVENFRPGVLGRLGIGHDALRQRNPRLIILSITGFGHDGPRSGQPGYDQIVQGEAGLMSLTGPDPRQPTKVGVPIADILAGIFGATGVLAALHRRAQTGTGDIVRTSLLAAIVAVHTFQGTRFLIGGEEPRPEGNHHPTVAPYGSYPTADGLIQIAVGNDRLWKRLAPLVQIDPVDLRFQTNADRRRNRAALDDLITEAFARETVADLLTRLDNAGVPAGAVRSLKDVYDDPQVTAQGMVLEVEHPQFGTMRLPGCPLRFDEGDARWHLAPPLLGQHDSIVAEMMSLGSQE